MKNLAKMVKLLTFCAFIGSLVLSCDYVEETEPPEYDELREVSTDGRLTITGLSNYEGSFISAHTNYGTDTVLDKEFILYAFEQLFHAYLDDKYVGVTESNSGMVIDGQSTLKIFKNCFGSKLYENYDGNDQNEEFHVGIWNANDQISTYGTVNVNFSNGIGIGTFIFVNDVDYNE